MDAPAREAAQAMVRVQVEARGVRDPRVLEAMRSVPRHLFTPGLSMEEAYSDHARPTAEGQTISQPYIVARMTELLEVEPGMKVLEIGTGSGYQTAVLAKLGAVVVSVERYDSLAVRAREALQRVGDELDLPTPPRVVTGDGTLGFEAEAPFDRILFTAAGPEVPDSYREQLADPGRIVGPVGDRYQQVLISLDLRDGRWERREDIGCRFVPLVGEQGWKHGE